MRGSCLLVFSMMDKDKDQKKLMHGLFDVTGHRWHVSTSIVSRLDEVMSKQR